jgi:hypothetical protein
VKERFGIAFSPKWIGQILTDLGFTPQRPRYRSDRQDPEAVEQWRTETFPLIDAQAREEGAEIFFGDESAIQLGFHAGTTRGTQRPDPDRDRRRPGRGPQDHHDGLGDLLCKRLMASTSKPVFLIVDNARIHHAKIVKRSKSRPRAEGRLRLFYLPPHSPQLNPDELVWNTVKNGRIGKAVIKNEHDMKRVALGALRSLQKLA